MALPAEQQIRYWSIATLITLGGLWLMGNVLLPFVLGAAVAYCLDPIADLLERWGLSRVLATVIITLAGALAFLTAVLLVIPTLVRQAAELFEAIPALLAQLQDFLLAKFPSIIDEESTIRQSLDQIGQMLKSRGGEFVEAALGSVSSLLSLVALIVIAPVVSFYLLLDWDRLIARIDALLPRDHAPTIRQIALDIDATLAGFIRGQGTVCLILGTYYSVALMLAGLNFGLVVGAVAGALTFIPYIGALVGGALALGLAFVQFWGEWHMIAVIAAIFFSGQFIEGNILTPKLVGESVGLHPVWILFALSVFGTAFGFVGMLVAVPLAAMIGVIVRFVTGEYLQGRLYRGREALADTSADPASDSSDAAE